jgi:hypothetical protein
MMLDADVVKIPIQPTSRYRLAYLWQFFGFWPCTNTFTLVTHPKQIFKPTFCVIHFYHQ